MMQVCPKSSVYPALAKTCRCFMMPFPPPISTYTPILLQIMIAHIAIHSPPCLQASSPSPSHVQRRDGPPLQTPPPPQRRDRRRRRRNGAAGGRGSHRGAVFGRRLGERRQRAAGESAAGGWRRK